MNDLTISPVNAKGGDEQYAVRWEISLTADSALEAVQKARWYHLNGPDCRSYEATGANGVRHVIDLKEFSGRG